MSILRLTMLPANEGDCLLLDYGEDEDHLRHVLIDGGRKATWRHLEAALSAVAARGETIDLMVLSHIDADHLDGLIAMAEKGSPLVPKAVWYNGFDQLKRLTPLGGVAPLGFKGADQYSLLLEELGWPVNADFNRGPVMIEARPEPFTFAGLTLTLISPDRGKLEDLRREWEKWREGQDDGGTGLSPSPAEAALAPLGKREMPDVLDVEALSAPGGDDNSEANGSSIAMIAEYAGKRVLLAADAHADLIEAGLAKAAGDEARVTIDLFKLSHHGSRGNLTEALLARIDCRRFAISTNGSRFGHPDPECIARLLRFGTPGPKTLYFNYATDRTTPLDDAALKAQWDYACVFPDAAPGGLVIDV
ncbi:ComEC/Rec2 family competence protein [Erythrobacter donghaensis]|uniref:ComEC/Rec2 family competence protein n=1 Tax=Erythrobacter donghaensis TaxID=267135 RepID=UPI000A372869|nr:hypothetical protein [Erythrobacter donghaensis]